MNTPEEDLNLANEAYSRGDYKKSFELELSAAKRGLPRAQARVGWGYLHGVGVIVNREKAIYWLDKAVKNNDPAGYYSISLAYLNGWGVEADLQKAFDYAIKAKNARYDASDDLLRQIAETSGRRDFTCMSYGFKQGTIEFAQCRLKIDQAQEQAEVALQQAAAAQREYDRRQAEARAAQALAQQAEAERRRNESADRLRQFSEDLLCPKQGPGMFAPPVPGCGRNKNVPIPPTVNVIVNHY